MSDDTIRVRTTDDPIDTKSALPSLTKAVSTVVTMSQEELAQRMADFLKAMQPMMEVDPPKTKGVGFFVDEIEFEVSINAKGGLELVGKLEAGAQAGIKLKLKRGIPPHQGTST